MKTAVSPGQGELFQAVDPAALELSVDAQPQAAPAPLAEQPAADYEDPRAKRRAEILENTMGWSSSRAAATAGLAEVATEQAVPLAHSRHHTARTYSPHRRRSGHGPQYGEDGGVGYPGDLPWELQSREPFTGPQLVSLTRGVALARQTLAAKGIPRS